MFNAERLQEKWAPVLGHEGASPIGDRYKKAVTSVLLENQERFLREERGLLWKFRSIAPCLVREFSRTICGSNKTIWSFSWRLPLGT